MSKIFLDYQEKWGDDTQMEQQESTQELIEKIDKLIRKVKKQKKQIKKIKRTIKVEKNNSIIKPVISKKSITEEKSDNVSDVKGDTAKKEKPFINRVGDALIKALPSIFRTIVSCAVTVVLSKIPKVFIGGKMRDANRIQMASAE